jgi:hypothetical protein
MKVLKKDAKKKTLDKKMLLNQNHAQVILECKGGADVFDFNDAKFLKEVQEVEPDWLWIGEAQNPHTDLKQKAAYFGCYPLNHALEWAKNEINKDE